eukprot:364003-Chlamydomonas_euryale.AAC.34
MHGGFRIIPALKSIIRRLPDNQIQILTMPLGPRVDLTRSAMATAPTKDACEAEGTVASA